MSSVKAWRRYRNRKFHCISAPAFITPHRIHGWTTIHTVPMRIAISRRCKSSRDTHKTPVYVYASRISVCHFSCSGESSHLFFLFDHNAYYFSAEKRYLLHIYHFFSRRYIVHVSLCNLYLLPNHVRWPSIVAKYLPGLALNMSN